MDGQQKREILRSAADGFWDMILLNIMFIFTCLPVITYGAAAGALYSAVSHLEEKDHYGGCAAMYWALFRGNLRRAVPPWCAVMAAALLFLVDLSIIGQMPAAAKYCSYGLQGFVLVLLQSMVTAGFPIISESGVSALEAVQRSLGVLARRPLLTLFSCVIQAAPFAFCLLAPKEFAWLFLLWSTVYFSAAERAIDAMIGRAIRQEIP